MKVAQLRMPLRLVSNLKRHCIHIAVALVGSKLSTSSDIGIYLVEIENYICPVKFNLRERVFICGFMPSNRLKRLSLIRFSKRNLQLRVNLQRNIKRETNFISFNKCTRLKQGHTLTIQMIN